MRTEKTIPCSACPFRTTSARGWLGPWRPRQLLNFLTVGREPFPCHRTIPCNPSSSVYDGLQACAGAAIYLNRTLALSRDPETACHQRKLKGLSILQNVFPSAAAFLAHHEP